MNHLFLGVSVFLACIVEMVEALTIVLAIGTTRDWRSTFTGAAAAIVCLAALVALFEPFLNRVSSGQNSHAIEDMWLFAGGLLLIFGMQWLKKAILRYAGLLATHDEAAAFDKVRKKAATASKKSKYRDIDWYAFVIVFKGVLLEGFEVIFIVLVFGVTEGNVDLGIGAAAAAFVLVALLGLVLHRPLARLPENTMKFAVSIILVTFGTYFSARGAGIIWPHGTVSVAGLLVFYLVLSGGLIYMLKAKMTLPVTQTSKGKT